MKAILGGLRRQNADLHHLHCLAPPGSPPDVWQQLQANLQECCDQSNVLALQYSESRRPSAAANISGSVAAMFRGVRRVLRRGIACAAAATALWGVLQVCEPR